MNLFLVFRFPQVVQKHTLGEFGADACVGLYTVDDRQRSTGTKPSIQVSSVCC